MVVFETSGVQPSMMMKARVPAASIDDADRLLAEEEMLAFTPPIRVSNSVAGQRSEDLRLLRVEDLAQVFVDKGIGVRELRHGKLTWALHGPHTR